MSLLKRTSIFFLFLIMSGGPTLLTVNQADAHCCSRWDTSCKHTAWGYMNVVYGSIKKMNSKGTLVRITDKEGNYRDVRADRYVVQAFEKEKTDQLQGFAFLREKQMGKTFLMGFARSNGDEKGTPSESDILAQHHEVFLKGAQKPYVIP